MATEAVRRRDFIFRPVTARIFYIQHSTPKAKRWGAALRAGHPGVRSNAQ
jgi:hypothetical protein